MGIIPCKNGADCPYLANNTCTYLHYKQDIRCYFKDKCTNNPCPYKCANNPDMQ